MDKDSTYRNAFIRVAVDCQAEVATEPILRNGSKTQAVLEHELLLPNPYKFTQDEFQFAVHLAHKGISKEETEKVRQEYFSVPHACLRASPLAKRWAWGFHFDSEGKVAMVPLGSEEYEKFASDPSLQQIPAMRSKRQH